MMKKVMLLCALAGVAALFAGCSTVQSVGVKDLSGQSLTPSGTTIAHVTASTGGFYFLWIPLLTGSEVKPGSIAFMEDSCHVTQTSRMVTREAQKLGATRTINMVSSQNSSMFPAPIPFLFYWKTATVSGNAVR